MRLESAIVIRRTPEQVWNFLGDASNVPKWDRGVAAVNATSPTTFETLAYSSRSNQGRMSYRIAEPAPGAHSTVQLTSSTGNARFFENAQWNFNVDPAPQGSRVICSVDFALRPQYFFLAPILFFMRSAIHRDLKSLKRAIERN